MAFPSVNVACEDRRHNSRPPSADETAVSVAIDTHNRRSSLRGKMSNTLHREKPAQLL